MKPKEKLKFIQEQIAEFELTAYEISKGTGLNAAGVQRIIKNEVDKPREDTLNKILDFIEIRITGTALPGHENYDPKIASKYSRVAEPVTEYKKIEDVNKQDIVVMQKKIADLAIQNMELTQENSKLKALLRKHNIDYAYIIVE